ncbi:MAG TPA: bifunctional [glutamine synthetase] adenylyltransferase/[glutamine synthetase]-adenylyl-L-tyrosine phosphorylase, partial [Devosia sp.]|nr:bifunctional [glutamine synthetase] adenylyltransferase/[glutamine synthetase]-adenylyl-L-tyrosine phosphorylase [Devosia sp.]
MPIPLDRLLAASPYLRELEGRHRTWLATAVPAADAALAAELAELGAAAGVAADEEAIGTRMRQAKGRIALLAAAAETGGLWSTQQATAALSDLADTALDAGLAVLLRRAHAKGDFLAEPAPGRSGLALFALGKHGGRELNYSSDIDIVAFFDRDAGGLADPDEATKTYSRIVQRLAALLQDRVGGDYVFRTDLRLRPDPGSTPVALSVDAALAY